MSESQQRLLTTSERRYIFTPRRARFFPPKNQVGREGCARIRQVTEPATEIKLNEFVRDWNAEILKCTHCGLCLNQCPTYRVLGWEMDSPRGRIRLMRGVTEGLFEVTPAFTEHMDVCLACRACQTACPASLNFGQMVEAARAQALQTLPQKPLPRFLRWLVLKQTFPYPARLKAVAALIRLYQRTGLQA